MDGRKKKERLFEANSKCKHQLIFFIFFLFACDKRLVLSCANILFIKIRVIKRKLTVTLIILVNKRAAMACNYVVKSFCCSHQPLDFY